jgi:hypothetical protein
MIDHVSNGKSFFSPLLFKRPIPGERAGASQFVLKALQWPRPGNGSAAGFFLGVHPNELYHAD